MAPKLTDKERSEVVVLLEEGHTPYKAAKLSGRSRPTVCKIAREEGFDINVNATKKATEASKAYAEARRLEIIGKGFDKANTLLEAITDAAEFQKWTVGLGTLVDKARLETGEVTDRREQHNHPHSLNAYFDELDAFRGEHGEIDTTEPVDTASSNSTSA